MSAHGSNASDTSAGRTEREIQAIKAKEKSGGFINVYCLGKLSSAYFPLIYESLQLSLSYADSSANLYLSVATYHSPNW